MTPTQQAALSKARQMIQHADLTRLSFHPGSDPKDAMNARRLLINAILQQIDCKPTTAAAALSSAIREREQCLNDF
jgi:hypothetical protein